MATRPQIAMIHTLKSKIGMCDDDYRAVLGGFGAESSKDLSVPDAKAVIEALMKLVPSGSFRRRAPSAPSREVASGKQQAYIRGLWDTVSRVPEGKDREAALNAFLRKRFNISFLNWLPRESVGKVIHTLEAMLKQKQDSISEVVV
jgi:hypothetical protein